MATSSIGNLFSFITPSKPPPSAPLKVPPPYLSTGTASPSSSSTNSRWSPLVLNNEAQSPACSSDVMSVVCPSLAHANVMFFRPYNVEVIVDENEPEDRLVSRFRREVMRAGIIQELRRRRYFEDKQDVKKRKQREAAKRNRRRHFRGRNGPQEERQDISVTANDQEDDLDNDNWDLPDVDIPY